MTTAGEFLPPSTRTHQPGQPRRSVCAPGGYLVPIAQTVSLRKGTLMLFSCLLAYLKPRSPRTRTELRNRAPRHRQARRRLWLEPLEDRCLLSTYTIVDLGTLGGTRCDPGAGGTPAPER